MIVTSIVYAGLGVVSWVLMRLGYLPVGEGRYGLTFAAAGVMLLDGLLVYRGIKRSGSLEK